MASLLLKDGRDKQSYFEQYRDAHTNPRIFAPATGPLRANLANPRYFTDGTGKAIFLVGSHTWLNFHDVGNSDPPPAFNFTQYLNFLSSHGHNFFRLWLWESSRWAVQTNDNDYWFFPQPWKRMGPGNAEDGKLKWNLDMLDQAYFDRLYGRCHSAHVRGIYVSIMLFNGWAVAKAKAGWDLQNPWRGHPFKSTNNVNGVNGDPNGDNSGEETHENTVAAVWKYQEDYIKKVIDTVNDLDNILYEISNESHTASKNWQYRVIDTIKAYESKKPKQHPVGMTSYVGLYKATNSDLFNSPADWISPNNGTSNEYVTEPPVATGSKVVILDTDHIWGIGGDRVWAWKSFARGNNILFMDGYDGNNNYGVGGNGWNSINATWISFRKNMGYIRTYANRMNLVAMTPQNHLSSTNYCLANAVPSGAEYLIYRPSSSGPITVNLTAASGLLSVEWFNPSTGHTMADGKTNGGGSRSFTAPFSGDAVLYIYADNPTISKLVNFAAGYRWQYG